MSLNAGYELDKELPIDVDTPTPSVVTAEGTINGILKSDFNEVVFDEVSAGEVPEIDDDISLITVVDKTKDLNYLKTDIVRTDGMNKAFALEAEKLMPGFLDDDRPVSFYTEFPSKTNYKLALEAISAEQKSLVRKIWDLLAKFLKNAMAWLDTFTSKIFKLSEKADSADKIYKDNTIAIDVEKAQIGFSDPKNVSNRVSLIVSDKKSDTFKAYQQSIEDKLSEGSDRLTSIYEQINKNNHVYTIVSRSTVVKTLLDIGMNADTIVSGYTEINKEWLNKMLTGQSDIKRNVEYIINRIHQPAKNQRLPTFESYAKTVELKMNQRDVKYNSKNMPMRELFKIFATTFKTLDMKKYQETIKKAVDNLDSIKKSIMDIANGQIQSNRTDDSTEDISSYMSEAVKTLHHELRSLLLLLKMSGDFFSAWIWMSKVLDSTVKDYRRRVMSNTNELPEDDRNKLKSYFGADMALA